MGRDLPLKILALVPYAPTRIRTRPYHLIRALAAEGHQITLATLWSDQQELMDLHDLAEHLHLLLADKISLGRSLWNCIRALSASRPIQASYSWSPELARRAIQALLTTDFDVVHIEHLRGARYGLLIRQALLRRNGRRPILVWDSVDCISALFRQASHFSCTFRSRLAAKIELPRTQRYEAWLPTQFDRVLVTSDAESRNFAALMSNSSQANPTAPSDMVVLPNGVDTEYFSPPAGPRIPLTLIMSGKMSYHANVTAVVHFVKEVMPAIWSTHPLTRLWVVGKDPAPEIKRLGILSKDIHRGATDSGGSDTRIQITGTVADVRPFLRSATLAVAPIRYGAGIQNKVLEALACGTPVVATPEAVTALQTQPGRELIVASSGRDFADSVSKLLSDPQRCFELGLAGRLFVGQNHAWSLIANRLTQTYRDAIAGRQARCCICP